MKVGDSCVAMRARFDSCCIDSASFIGTGWKCWTRRQDGDGWSSGAASVQGTQAGK